MDHGAIRRFSSAATGLGSADFRRRLQVSFCVFCVICGLSFRVAAAVRRRTGVSESAAPPWGV